MEELQTRERAGRLTVNDVRCIRGWPSSIISHTCMLQLKLYRALLQVLDVHMINCVNLTHSVHVNALGSSLTFQVFCFHASLTSKTKGEA